MEDGIRELLLQLSQDALDSQNSEIRGWFRETLEMNITRLLNEDASHAQIKNCLIGGFRALYDSEKLPEDDPILNAMEALYQRL